MDLIERAARAIAKGTLTEAGVEAFEADPAYYRRDFSPRERASFERCAHAAVLTVKAAIGDRWGDAHPGVAAINAMLADGQSTSGSEK